MHVLEESIEHIPAPIAKQHGLGHSPRFFARVSPKPKIPTFQVSGSKLQVILSALQQTIEVLRFTTWL
eukprot:Pgem_evm1s8590